MEAGRGSRVGTIGPCGVLDVRAADAASSTMVTFELETRSLLRDTERNTESPQSTFMVLNLDRLCLGMDRPYYYHWPFCPYRYFALLSGFTTGNRALVCT